MRVAGEIAQEVKIVSFALAGVSQVEQPQIGQSEDLSSRTSNIQQADRCLSLRLCQHYVPLQGEGKAVVSNNDQIEQIPCYGMGIGVRVSVGSGVAVDVLAVGVGLATGVQAAKIKNQTSVTSFAYDLIVPPSIPVTGFLKPLNGCELSRALRVGSMPL